MSPATTMRTGRGGREGRKEVTDTRERDRFPSPGIRLRVVFGGAEALVRFARGWKTARLRGCDGRRGLLLDRLQVVDDLGALLCVRDAGKRHRVSGDPLLRVGEESVERFFVPGYFR